MMMGAQDYGLNEVGIIYVTFVRWIECFMNMERWRDCERIDLEQLGWSIHRYQMGDQVLDRLGSDKTTMSRKGVTNAVDNDKDEKTSHQEAGPSICHMAQSLT
jgi:hypothetical protein